MKLIEYDIDQIDLEEKKYFKPDTLEVLKCAMKRKLTLLSLDSAASADEKVLKQNSAEGYKAMSLRRCILLS